MRPNTYERLQKLFARSSSFLEIGHTEPGVRLGYKAGLSVLAR
jgi:hypothetical protein